MFAALERWLIKKFAKRTKEAVKDFSVGLELPGDIKVRIKLNGSVYVGSLKIRDNTICLEDFEEER
jgi:hypothetical protein